MIVVRKRLLFWLIKAYIKRWGKSIIVCFGIGLVVFFLLNMAFSYFLTRLPFMQKETIGMVGSYTVDSLPQEVLSKISKGLTKTEADGSVTPDIAEKWKIAPNGKAYAFYLRKDIRFSDGTQVTSSDINYDFADAKWKFYCSQARNQSNFPSIDKYESFMNQWVRLVPNLNRHANFFENLGTRETLDRGRYTNYGIL